MVVLFALKNFGVSFELKTPREYRKQQRPARRKTKIPHRKRSLRKLSALPIRGKPNENTLINTRLLAKTADKKSKFSGLPATCVAVAFRQTNSYHSGATASESNGLPFVRGFSFKEQIRFKTLWDIRQLKFFSKFFRGLRRFFMAFQILTSRLCVFIFSLSAEALRVPLLFIFCKCVFNFAARPLCFGLYRRACAGGREVCLLYRPRAAYFADMFPCGFFGFRILSVKKMGRNSRINFPLSAFVRLVGNPAVFPQPLAVLLGLIIAGAARAAVLCVLYLTGLPRLDLRGLNLVRRIFHGVFSPCKRLGKTCSALEKQSEF